MHERFRRLLPWLLTVLLALAACAAPDLPLPAASPRTETIFVIGRGWHTDIGLPAAATQGALAPVAARFPGLRVLSVGFGERAYVLSHDTGPFGMLRALLPSESALLATGLSDTPQAAFGAAHVVALRVSAAGLARLQARIGDEIERDAAGLPVGLGEGPYPGSLFYAARGTYDAFNTCNSWTAAMLRVAGLDVPTLGVVFAGQVMGPARRLAARQ